MRLAPLPTALLLSTVAVFGSAVDQGLLHHVPANTQVLAGVRLDESKPSPLGRYFLARLSQDDSNFRELINTTGFDPRRDLQEVLFASSGSEPSDTHHPSVVLARGVFDIARVKQAMIAKGGTAERLNDSDLLLNAKRDSAITFLDSTLAAAGNPTEIRKLLRATGRAAISPTLLSKMEKVSTHNQIWFASVASGASLSRFGGHEPNHGISGALQSIEQSSGGLRLGSNGIDVSVEALAHTEQDARALADVVRFFSSMAQMQRQGDSPVALLAPSLDTMQLTTEGNKMQVFLSVPETVAEQLLDMTNHGEHGRLQMSPSGAALLSAFLARP